ncbi:hypothetical protein CEXT_554131 [Caerostris extrusa]|uniref:Uncharacterized protein n=1 Tax=Caerostris extrusa TaxID=172846 RepID=A0AAV4PBF4_CAEEX|nr:hypothetical protein CEXT_554131 [Caerostris extrusa]
MRSSYAANKLRNIQEEFFLKTEGIGLSRSSRAAILILLFADACYCVMSIFADVSSMMQMDVSVDCSSPGKGSSRSPSKVPVEAADPATVYLLYLIYRDPVSKHN